MATPISAEFRYIYCLFTSMPLFCTIPFLDVKAGKIDDKEAATEEKLQTGSDNSEKIDTEQAEINSGDI